MIDPDRHAGKSYRPTGPALLSATDMAAILGRVLQRKVRRLDMPFWLFLKAARLRGLPAFDMSGFRFYVEDHKQGAFEFGAPTTDVLDVTGRPAEDFETTARRYAATPGAKRTLSNGVQGLCRLHAHARSRRATTSTPTTARCASRCRRRRGS